MENQVVVVTGGTTGFGRLTVETLARQGFTVFAAMRDTEGKNRVHAEALRELADRDGLNLAPVQVDISDEASVEAGVAEVVAQAGRVDVLVNNAGQGTWGVAEAFTTAQIQTHFDVNFFGAVRMNRAVLPHMREQGSGLLIHVSSLIGRLVLPFMTHYSAVKHALEAYAEGTRYELAPFKVDSVIVEPQSFPTEGSLNKMVFPADEARVRAYGALAGRGEAMFNFNDQNLRGGESGNPQDVADAIARLIHMPYGSCPLRTTVGGPMTGLVAPINATTEQVQAQLLQYTGLSDLLGETACLGVVSATVKVELSPASAGRIRDSRPQASSFVPCPSGQAVESA